VFLYCLCQLCCGCVCLGGGGGVAPPYFYIQGGRGYKESPQVCYNCSPSRTLSLIFSNYKIWSYPSSTLSLEVILPPSCCNVGLCQPLHGHAESSRSCWQWHCRVDVGCGAMSLPSHVGDGILLLPSHAGDGMAEATLAMTLSTTMLTWHLVWPAYKYWVKRK
jgi:hypothetical protein